MQIRKLEGWQEWLEADRLIATAFLHPWDAGAVEGQRKAEADGSRARTEEAWGDLDDRGNLRTAIITHRLQGAFDGQFVPMGELDMVGSLPEYRGGGNVRAMFGQILRDFRDRGDLFALLVPFSFAFYRKFGFEVCARNLQQRVPIEQFSAFRCQCAVQQVQAAEDVPVLRDLFQRYALGNNLTPLRADADWEWKGDGEYGQRDWLSMENRRYTYLFGDGEPGSGRVTEPRGYLRFYFKTGEAGPFIGTMCVEDLVFDGPQTLQSIFGFIYGMRAKLVDVTFGCLNADLALMVPEAGEVKTEVEGHFMARILDVECVLRAMRYPAGRGSFSVCVADDFLPQNAGCYRVAYCNGGAAFVVRMDEGEVDLAVDERVLTQMVVGLIDLRAAELRPTTQVFANRETLERVFVRKDVWLG